MPKTAKKKVTRKTKTSAPTNSTSPKLLSGGNPQIPKGDGDGPVQAYIAAVPGWKQEIAKKLDKLIMKAVPKAYKAVRWNSPFYGVDGMGWIVSYHCFTNYMKVTFFAGSSLKPLPPGISKDEKARYLDIYEDGFDETQFVKWVQQAIKIPGWGGN